MSNPAQNGRQGAPNETLGKAKDRLSMLEERLNRTGDAAPAATPAPPAPAAAAPAPTPQPPEAPVAQHSLAVSPAAPFAPAAPVAPAPAAPAPAAPAAPATHADLYDDPDLQMPGSEETFPAIEPTAPVTSAQPAMPVAEPEPAFPEMDPSATGPFAAPPVAAPAVEPAAPIAPPAPQPETPSVGPFAPPAPSTEEPFPFAMPTASAPVAEPVVPVAEPIAGPFAPPAAASEAPFAPASASQFAAPPVEPAPAPAPQQQFAPPATEPTPAPPSTGPVVPAQQFAPPAATSAPEPAPALDDFDAPPPLPMDSPVLSADDHEPAYASLAIEPHALTKQLVEIPEPEDALFAIATADPDAEREQTSSKVVENMRRGAVEEQGSGKKRGKQRVPLQPLPFDALVPGNPLIATIYSPSGGVGKSSTSMNLGVYIAAVAQTMANKARQKGDEAVRVPRILAIDGDIVMGSLLLRLIGNMEPNIHDLQMYIDEREEQGFTGESAWPSSYDTAPPGEEPMSKFVHWPDKLPNFNVLGAPKEPDLFWDFGPAEYRQIINMLGRFYDVIIIDAGTDLVLESQRAWLAHANEVFLIMSPEIDRIYNAAKAARHMAKRRPHPQDNRENPELLPPLVTRDKLSVVMTRCDTDSGLDLPEVVDHFFDWMTPDQKFWIPDVSTAMLQANNQGRFLVLDDPTYAKVIGGMAKHLFQRYSATKKQRGLPSVS